MSRQIFKTIILIFTTILIISCDREDELINENIADFELIYSSIQSYYPFLDLKSINLDSIHNEFLPLFDNANPNELKDLYVKFLSELKDGHANVY